MLISVPTNDYIPYLGERFDSYEAANASVMTNWALAMGQQISIHDCKTIEAANYKMTIRPELVYAYVVYKCHFHGEYVPKGSGQRQQKYESVITFLHIILIYYII